MFRFVAYRFPAGLREFSGLRKQNRRERNRVSAVGPQKKAHLWHTALGWTPRL